MRIEEHFRQTLTQAVANEPPVIDAWERFERRAGRSRRWRFAVSLAAGIAVIAAAVLVVPRLGSKPTEPIVPGPTVDPYEGWKTFEHGEQGYRVRYPADWQLSTFEGNWEIRPPGLPGLTAGAEETFGVDIVVIEQQPLDAPAVGETERRGTRPDGRAYVRTEPSYEGVRRIVYRIDWSSSKCGIPPDVCPPDDDLMLVATIAGGDRPDLFEKYRGIGEQIVRSIERVA